MPTVENTYKWKVSVIAQYTDSWATEYQLLIDAIKAQLNTPKIHFIIFKYYADTTPNADPNANCKASLIEYYQGGDGIEKPLAPCNLYNAQTLTDFFKDHVETVTADAHILITWGHGAGLGYFEPPSDNDGGGIETPAWAKPVSKERPDVFPINKHHGRKPPSIIEANEFINTAAMLKANLSRSATSVQGQEAASLNFNVKIRDNLYEIKDLKTLDDTLVLVTAEQLAGNLKALSQPIDLFIACNCYCQMFDSGLALMETVRLMVAAETSYPITGFNYTPFFQAIQKDISRDFVGLAKNVCDNFMAKYKGPAAPPIPAGVANFNFDHVSISANDLSGYNDLLLVVNRLADWQVTNFNALSPEGKAWHNYMYTARGSCGDFSNSGCLIDLHQYLDQLNASLSAFNLLDFKAIYQDFLALQTKCLIDILLPKKQIIIPGPFIPPFPPVLIYAIPQFLSVFFPDAGENSSANAIYSRYYAPGAQGTAQQQKLITWDDFVRKYYIQSSIGQKEIPAK